MTQTDPALARLHAAIEYVAADFDNEPHLTFIRLELVACEIVAAVVAERDAARAVLCEVEWEGGLWGAPACLLCGNRDDEGHTPTCRLAAALAPAGERDAVTCETSS